MTPMSASERYGSARVLALSLQLRDGLTRAGRMTALDKVPGSVGTMDLVYLVGELLDSVAESGGLPAHDAPPAPPANPCALIDLPDTTSPLRGARTMDSAPTNGEMVRVFVDGGCSWAVGWHYKDPVTGSSWKIIIKSKLETEYRLEAKRPDQMVAWLPMKGEPSFGEPTGQEVADQFLRLRDWFEFSAMNLQNATPDGNNPAGYRGAHPCDCMSFAADAVDQVEAFVLASRGRGSWPTLRTALDSVPVETSTNPDDQV